MHPALFDFDIDFDRERLLDEAGVSSGYETFLDPLNNRPANGWLIKRIDSGYGLEVSNFFKDLLKSSDCRPRFYVQQPKVTIPFHTDRSTLCSINILLTDKTAPIFFRSGPVHYNTALLNTTVEHAVFNPSETRILYKISIFDKTFEEVKEKLPQKIQYR